MNPLIQEYLNKEASLNKEFSDKLAKWNSIQLWNAITDKVLEGKVGDCVCMSDDDVYRLVKDIVNDEQPPKDIKEKPIKTNSKTDDEEDEEQEEDEEVSEELRKKEAKQRRERAKIEAQKKEEEARRKAGVSKDQLSLFKV